MLLYGATWTTLFKNGCLFLYHQHQAQQKKGVVEAVVGINGSHMNSSDIILSCGGSLRPRCFWSAGQGIRRRRAVIGGFVTTSAAAAALMFWIVVGTTSSIAFEVGVGISQQQQQAEPEEETLSNIPQTLSGGQCSSQQGQGDCKKKGRIQRPKSKKAESCTIKCVNTCIRGEEGPLNIRRPLVVFKQGFRSRQYCLVECSDICNLIGDGDDGP
ncbi:uncharacterized protein LOC127794573 isoform X1 [Diospyros lotus]|uniref:uncharacterized protein LOC127794573 isoform X1 n=1 Tax=Diospyros lotus TaxID=55363 RepID=UPI00224F6054|nr:uncharacterized protein LOC127794573 isoform X1 [Diospyros lotus]